VDNLRIKQNFTKKVLVHIVSFKQFIPLKQLHRSPYAEILCYPKFDRKELQIRLEELGQLDVTVIAFTGKKSVLNMPILGKGCVGIVVKAFIDAEVVALKIRRTDANRTEMKHEAEMLKIANSLNIGPKLINMSKNFLLMEFVEGQLFPGWLEVVKSKQRIRNVLRFTLEQCWQLDKAGLDHGELSRAPKHIIVKNNDVPCIVDFETASVTRRVSNLTSICQYFFIANQTAKLMAEKLGVFEGEVLKQVLRKYKEKMTSENFEDVLKTVNLTENH